jgi:uncharacterized membrane protein (DUF2068 family)
MNRFPGIGGRRSNPPRYRHPSGIVLCRTVSSWDTSQVSEMMEHHALDRRHFTKTSVVLRTIAMFEVTKAAIVLLLGCGLFHLMRQNLDDVAQRIVQVLHVNPEGKVSNLFFELASHASDRNLWVLALSILAYASVNLTEAYGLWREREWAQWFSLLSTALYVPPELYWILRNPGWLKCAVLVTNIVMFLFMLSLCVNRRSTVVRNTQMQSMRTGDQPPRAVVQECVCEPVSPLAPRIS